MSGKRSLPAIDPALADEARRMVGRVHGLMKDGDAARGPARRMVMDVPEAWMLLAAWLERRRCRWMAAQDAPVPAEIGDPWDHATRQLARRYIRFLLNEQLHAELHDLATGSHPFLRPLPAAAAHPAADDVDDDLPF